MLFWKAERGSKTRQGQDKASGHRAFYATAEATDNERRPVKYYKLFRSHRPIEMNQPEAPFYLAVKHQRKATDAVWYKKSLLGKNEIIATHQSSPKCWFARTRYQSLGSKDLHFTIAGFRCS